MTSDYDNTDRLAIEITECKHMGIEVLPPDINESFHEFGVIKGENKIRYGLDAIKNVGHGAAEEILRAREEAGGRFDDLSHYCQLVSCRIVNRKSLESLVKAGAFDSFGERSQLVNNIDNILNLSQKLQKDSAAGQVDLFGEEVASDMAPRLKLEPNLVEYTQTEQLTWERELLGIYLSHNPLMVYEKALNSLAKPIGGINKDMDGKMITVGGSVSSLREISTKSGSKMAFVRLTDSSSEMELVVFPKTYSSNQSIWQRDNVLLAKGKIDYSRSDEPKLLVEEAKLITEDDARNFKPGSGGSSLTDNLKQRLYIRLEDSGNQPLLLTLKEKLDGHQGDTEVVLVTGESATKQIIKLPQMISINEQSLRELASLFGSTNVVVR
jgi:DNA polymerase-3 subunit alpha